MIVQGMLLIESKCLQKNAPFAVGGDGVCVWKQFFNRWQPVFSFGDDCTGMLYKHCAWACVQQVLCLPAGYLRYYHDLHDKSFIKCRAKLKTSPKKIENTKFIYFYKNNSVYQEPTVKPVLPLFFHNYYLVVQSHQTIFKVIKPFSKSSNQFWHDLPTFNQWPTIFDTTYPLLINDRPKSQPKNPLLPSRR